MSDEAGRAIRKAYFDKWIEGRAAVLGYQIELGKWLMASLLTLHGGALVGIINLYDRHPRVLAAGTPFCVGLVLGLSCGFAAYLNASIVADIYDDVADPQWVDNPESVKPVSNIKHWFATAATVASYTLGVASVVAGCVGAFALRSGLIAAG
jgi:hypothetical protein